MNTVADNYLFILDGSTGAVLNAQRIVLGATTEHLYGDENNYLLQNLDDTAQTDITNYRVYMGFRDDTTTGANTFQI